MNFYKKRLQNGLGVLTVPMPSLESATVTVWVKTGSRNESEQISGISHFLEHMAFKGGKKYKSAKAVSEAIDRIGGEFNASTSKEYTVYFIKSHNAEIETAFDVLSDMILSPLLKDSDIKREKGVIIEEMRMYEDTPMRRIWDRFEQLIFEGTRLGTDIIGTKDSVMSLKRTDFSGYLSKYYYADNVLITVAGGINVSRVNSLSERYFGSMQSKSGEKTNKISFNQVKPNVRLHTKDIEQCHFILGFPTDPLGKEERYVDAVLSGVLGGGMSSRLFTEVREKRGLAYSVRSEFDRFIDTGYFSVYAGTDPKKAFEAIKVILTNLYGFGSKFKLNKKELEKAKGYLKGHLALSLEDTSDVNAFFGHEYLMLGKVRTPEEVFKKIDKVKIEEVITRVRKIFDPRKINLAIIGPYENESEFAKILR